MRENITAVITKLRRKKKKNVHSLTPHYKKSTQENKNTTLRKAVQKIKRSMREFGQRGQDSAWKSQ